MTKSFSIGSGFGPTVVMEEMAVLPLIGRILSLESQMEVTVGMVETSI